MFARSGTPAAHALEFGLALAALVAGIAGLLLGFAALALVFTRTRRAA